MGCQNNDRKITVNGALNMNININQWVLFLAGKTLTIPYKYQLNYCFQGHSTLNINCGDYVGYWGDFKEHQ